MAESPNTAPASRDRIDHDRVADARSRRRGRRRRAAPPSREPRELVFQDFVEVALGDVLGPLGIRVRGQDPRHTLDKARMITLKPDLVLERDGRPALVGDSKYKRLEVTGLPNADVYQALAYAVGLGLPVSVLVYPAGETGIADHVIVNARVRVAVRTLNLELEPDDLLSQVGGLASELAGLVMDGAFRQRAV